MMNLSRALSLETNLEVRSWGMSWAVVDLRCPTDPIVVRNNYASAREERLRLIIEAAQPEASAIREMTEFFEEAAKEFYRLAEEAKKLEDPAQC